MLQSSHLPEGTFLHCGAVQQREVRGSGGGQRADEAQAKRSSDSSRDQGGARSRRSQAGTQTAARKAANGGVHGGRIHGGSRAGDTRGQLMETEPMEEEPKMEMESHGARVTPSIQRAKEELMREPGIADGMTVHGGDEGALSQGGADGSGGLGGVWRQRQGILQP